MTRQEIVLRIAAVITEAKLTQVPAEAITETSDLQDDLGMDSVKTVETLVQVEDAFGIAFSDSELVPSRLTTIARIADLVQSHLVAR